MDLDLSFLYVRLASALPQPRPVNVFEILRDSWHENRVDMTLQYFLDPSERHGLGSLVMDALLRLLDGAPTIGITGTTDVPFDAEHYQGSADWDIGTQVDFIDVYAVNRELEIALVLENKVGHELNNPLDRYAGRAFSDLPNSPVLVAVLAPELRRAPAGLEQWLSRSFTYVLDFVNEPGDVLDAFTPYYKAATLTATTDPNLIDKLNERFGDKYGVCAIDLAFGTLAGRLALNEDLIAQAKVNTSEQFAGSPVLPSRDASRFWTRG